jgi:alpha-tubulin suppressor-like RCC1 family protein
LAIDFDDAIWSFGANSSGQLGLGDTKSRLIPTKLPHLKAKSISTHDYHTIVIDLTDGVWVFGNNKYGQLGLGDTVDRLRPIKIENFKFKFASVGKYHTVALDFNNEVWVFGDNNYGQLGLGHYQNKFRPTKIPSQAFGWHNFKIKAIAAGAHHTVALDFNNKIWAFGSNDYGELGLNDTSERVTPTKISSEDLGLKKVKSIFAGQGRTMAIDFNNNVWVNFALTLS